MKTTPVTTEDLQGVFPVPPLARKNNAKRELDFEQNKLIVRHIANGGMTPALPGMTVRQMVSTRKNVPMNSTTYLRIRIFLL